MDKKFFQILTIVLVAVVGYSVLSTPGMRFDIDIWRLKSLLMYVLLGACAYAIYVTVRGQRRPPGV